MRNDCVGNNGDGCGGELEDRVLNEFYLINAIQEVNDLYGVLPYEVCDGERVYTLFENIKDHVEVYYSSTGDYIVEVYMCNRKEDILGFEVRDLVGCTDDSIVLKDDFDKSHGNEIGYAKGYLDSFIGRINLGMKSDYCCIGGGEDFRCSKCGKLKSVQYKEGEILEHHLVEGVEYMDLDEKERELKVKEIIEDMMDWENNE